MEAGLSTTGGGAAPAPAKPPPPHLANQLPVVRAVRLALAAGVDTVRGEVLQGEGGGGGAQQGFAPPHGTRRPAFLHVSYAVAAPPA